MTDDELRNETIELTLGQIWKLPLWVRASLNAHLGIPLDINMARKNMEGPKYQFGKSVTDHISDQQRRGASFVDFMDEEPTPKEAFRYGQEYGRLDQRVRDIESNQQQIANNLDRIVSILDNTREDAKRTRKIAVFAHEKIHNARAMVSTIIYSLGQLIRQDPSGPGPSVVTETLERLDRDGLKSMQEKHVAMFGEDDDEVPI